jgi:hypothetical protein
MRDPTLKKACTQIVSMETAFSGLQPSDLSSLISLFLNRLFSEHLERGESRKVGVVVCRRSH